MQFMFSGAAGILFLASAATAPAQTPVDPGRVDERLRERPADPETGLVETPTLPPQQQAFDSAISVVLREVRFSGAVSVPEPALQALAASYLGREMPVTETFELAEAVTAEYRRRGHVLSRAIIPPQRIEDGVLTVEILEGYVDEVAIEGDPGGYRPFLEGYMTSVTEKRPASGTALSRALLLARDLRGADVRAVIAPSETQTAAANLTLVVERDPIEAYVAADNRGSRWLGPLQIYAGVVANDLLGIGERLALSGVVTPDDRELGFVSLVYDQPLGGSGLRLNLFGSYADTRPGDELARLGLEGESTTWGGGLQYPFVRSRNLNVFGRASFTARDSKSSNDIVTVIFDDSIRTLSGELFVNHADRWGGLSTVSGSVTRGLDWLGATDDASATKSRQTGSAEFWRFNIEVSRVQQIAGRLYLSIAGAAQVSPDSLLASEEFGLGGTRFARAYDPSEVTGDEGIAGRAELFYTLPPLRTATLEPYVYYEAGKVYQNDPLPGEPDSQSLRSAGMGLRMSVGGRFNASIEYAEPLNRPVLSEGDGDGRFFFSLGANF